MSDSFMLSFGLTCPAREKIEQDGVEKYKWEHLQKLLVSHETSCDVCKADYEELYNSGMLNGKRPDHLKE